GRLKPSELGISESFLELLMFCDLNFHIPLIHPLDKHSPRLPNFSLHDLRDSNHEAWDSAHASLDSAHATVDSNQPSLDLSHPLSSGSRFFKLWIPPILHKNTSESTHPFLG
ncbi:hypothetical protein U1Q18_022880, partial [Sarracenia purpurea var. burkii]